MRSWQDCSRGIVPDIEALEHDQRGVRDRHIARVENRTWATLASWQSPRLRSLTRREGDGLSVPADAILHKRLTRIADTKDNNGPSEEGAVKRERDGDF